MGTLKRLNQALYASAMIAWFTLRIWWVRFQMRVLKSLGGR